ncbi:MAG: hypothetical protein WC333_00485 [Dehalococcoidia bacterium]|jgi:hypothetical protein
MYEPILVKPLLAPFTVPNGVLQAAFPLASDVNTHPDAAPVETLSVAPLINPVAWTFLVSIDERNFKSMSVVFIINTKKRSKFLKSTPFQARN